MNITKLFCAVLAFTTVAVGTASSQEIRQQVAIEQFGGWARTHGDRDMDTNANDRVPASCTSRLFFSVQKVFLDLHFYCEEIEGDNTRFEGDRTITLFTAPANKRIIGLRFGSGAQRDVALRSFHGISQGENHLYRLFRTPIAGTYWEKLRYRVDSALSNDSPYVGISGTVAFTVLLADQ